MGVEYTTYDRGMTVARYPNPNSLSVVKPNLGYDATSGTQRFYNGAARSDSDGAPTTNTVTKSILPGTYPYQPTYVYPSNTSVTPLETGLSLATAPNGTLIYRDISPTFLTTNNVSVAYAYGQKSDGEGPIDIGVSITPFDNGGAYLGTGTGAITLWAWEEQVNRWIQADVNGSVSFLGGTRTYIKNPGYRIYYFQVVSFANSTVTVQIDVDGGLMQTIHPTGWS